MTGAEKLRVLVVEDDPIALLCLRGDMEYIEGVIVTFVENVTDAVDAITESVAEGGIPFTLAFIDGTLPTKKDGFMDGSGGGYIINKTKETSPETTVYCISALGFCKGMDKNHEVIPIRKYDPPKCIEEYLAKRSS